MTGALLVLHVRVERDVERLRAGRGGGFDPIRRGPLRQYAPVGGVFARDGPPRQLRPKKRAQAHWRWGLGVGLGGSTARQSRFGEGLEEDVENSPEPPGASLPPPGCAAGVRLLVVGLSFLHGEDFAAGLEFAELAGPSLAAAGALVRWLFASAFASFWHLNLTAFANGGPFANGGRCEQKCNN